MPIQSLNYLVFALPYAQIHWTRFPIASL